MTNTELFMKLVINRSKSSKRKWWLS